MLRPGLGLSGKRCVGSGGFHSWVVFSSRPAKVIANVFSVGFHLVTQRALAPPVGSSDRVTRYRHLIAAASFGKCPRARTTFLYRALIDSIALVVQITRRISTWYSRNGTNFAQELRQRCTIAGYLWPHSAASFSNRSFVACFDGGGVDGFEENGRSRRGVAARRSRSCCGLGGRCTAGRPFAPKWC